MYADDIKNLLQFMHEAHLNTYAAPIEISQRHQLIPPINEGHIEHLYEQGPWRYHNSYIGEQNAPGREIIYFNGQPVWTMSYQSQLFTEDAGVIFETYNFLKQALMNAKPEEPFRGPKEYDNGEFTYSFIMINGDMHGFIGKEEIYHDGQLVYVNHTIGTVIAS